MRAALAVCTASVLLVGCGRVEYPPTAEGRYLAHCARCHEPDGSSVTASKQAKKAVDLRTRLFQDNTTDEDIARVVMQGKGRMMPVAGLTAAELDSIVLHVRRLGAAGGSALDTPRSET